MKTRLFSILSSILFLLSSTLLFSQDENYDAVYLQLTKIYTLNTDGSMDFGYVKKLKLQTYRSFNSLYGETFIVYNPDFQSLKINEAYTIMADGKNVPAPKNAFNEVLPGFASNAPAYNNLREMVVTHPGTERNAVLNLDYTLHTKKGFYPALMGNEVLAESEPVKELTVKIRVPAAVKLNYKILNDNSSPVETNEEGYRIYTWKFLNVPAMSAEEFQKGGYDLYPRLIFSTAKDREDVYRGLWQSAVGSSQLTVGSQQSDQMNKCVEDIKNDSKDEISILLKLEEKVVNEFRLWPVPLRFTGFTCRPAEETWKSNGGTLAEKAILLVSLLKTAGISAEPVLVIRKSLFDEKIGSLLDVEDVIVKAMPKTSDVLYLSVSALNPQNLTYGLPERMFVSLRPQENPEITATKETESRIALNAVMTVDDKRQMSGEVSITFTNNSNPWFALLRDNAKGKSYFGGFSSSDLKEQKVITTGPEEGYLKYTMAKEKSFHKDTNFYTYNLPYATNGIESWGIRLLPKSRVSSFEVPSKMEEDYNLTFNLPEGMRLFPEENKTEIKNSAGEFAFEVKKKGNAFLVSKHIRLVKRVFDPSEYNEFKALMDRWNDEKFKKIILLQSGPAYH